MLLLLCLAIFGAAAGSPNGWKWDKPAKADPGPQGSANGWSWNDGEVVAEVGTQVAVAGDTSTLGATAPAGTDPSIGDQVVVVTNGDKTLVGFTNDSGGTSWTAGWSWND
jgi:hypothetical protein